MAEVVRAVKVVNLVKVLMLCAVAGCAALPGQHTATRFNELQFIGSHNSYKQAIDAQLLGLLRADNPALAQSLDYAHLPLAAQLDLGLRKLELDMFYDPEGGRFAAPQGLRSITNPSPYDTQAMLEPGFKVMHVQDIDFRSHCLLLRVCLQRLAAWSDSNPGHTPVVITINAKDAVIDQAGFAEPLPYDLLAWDALDTALRRGLGERLFEPDDLRGDAASLPDAIASGWPALPAMRGRFLVVLDHGGAKLASYVQGHAALAGRAMFVNAPRGTPEAAVLIINDPVARADEITAAVKAGYLVRTRSDADTREAREGDYARMRAAFASGAQIISTDYYLPEARFGHGFHVRFPDASFVRCNPVLKPECELRGSGAAALAGSRWQLVDFLSMDDAIGRIVPPPEARYTLSFEADGTVSMQLNCNRGRSTWQAVPGEGGSSGQFVFGAVASTRALCPPPNMDAQLTRDLKFVRSFVMQDGRLYLSLYADGGTYQFSRMEKDR